MKCKIFWGCVRDAQEQFDTWAKGKMLTRDVIIHTQVAEKIVSCESTTPVLLIIVFHPEGLQWDVPHITAPVHAKPEPHIKAEEVAITQ